MQTPGAKYASLPSSSLIHSPFIPFWHIPLPTFPKLVLVLTSVNCSGLFMPPTLFQYPHLLSGCTLNCFVQERHASCLCFAYGRTRDMLRFFNSPLPYIYSHLPFVITAWSQPNHLPLPHPLPAPDLPKTRSLYLLNAVLWLQIPTTDLFFNQLLQFLLTHWLPSSLLILTFLQELSDPLAFSLTLSLRSTFFPNQIRALSLRFWANLRSLSPIPRILSCWPKWLLCCLFGVTE